MGYQSSLLSVLREENQTGEDMSEDFVSFSELEAYQLCVKAGIISMSTSDDGTEGSKHILDLAKKINLSRGVGCPECERLKKEILRLNEIIRLESFGIDSGLEKDIEFDLTDETIAELKKLTGKVPDTSEDTDEEL
ncbi:MAG: hypothetical protein WC776_05460 [Patescibacteria group bacterium]